MANLTIDEQKTLILDTARNLKSDKENAVQERDVALAKVATLEAEVTKLKADISGHKCPTVQTVDMSKWEINGMQVQEGNKTFNYKLK